MNQETCNLVARATVLAGEQVHHWGGEAFPNPYVIPGGPQAEMRMARAMPVYRAFVAHYKFFSRHHPTCLDTGTPCVDCVELAKELLGENTNEIDHSFECGCGGRLPSHRKVETDRCRLSITRIRNER